MSDNPSLDQPNAHHWDILRLVCVCLYYCYLHYLNDCGNLNQRRRGEVPPALARASPMLSASGPGPATATWRGRGASLRHRRRRRRAPPSPARPAPRGRRLGGCCAGAPPGGHRRGLRAKCGREQCPGCQGQLRAWWQPCVVCPRSKSPEQSHCFHTIRLKVIAALVVSLRFDVLLKAFCIFFFTYSQQKQKNLFVFLNIDM